MNVVAEKRETTNMRRIRKGDRFMENGIEFECVGFPTKEDGETVRVPLKRVGKRSRTVRYFYNGDHRVKIVGRA